MVRCSMHILLACPQCVFCLVCWDLVSLSVWLCGSVSYPFLLKDVVTVIISCGERAVGQSIWWER